LQGNSSQAWLSRVERRLATGTARAPSGEIPPQKPPELGGWPGHRTSEQADPPFDSSYPPNG